MVTKKITLGMYIEASSAVTVNRMYAVLDGDSNPRDIFKANQSADMMDPLYRVHC